MNVAAILTIPEARLRSAQPELAEAGEECSSKAFTWERSIAQWNLLGQSVLDRMVGHLRVLQVGEISVLEEPAQHFSLEDAFQLAWKSVISSRLESKVDAVILIRLNAYLEINFADFVRFHQETAGITQAYDQHGPLDVVAIDAQQLRNRSDSSRSWLQNLFTNHRQYRLGAYGRPLITAADFRELTRDALNQRVPIPPKGREIRSNIWLGEDAQIDPSVSIVAPAYIGKNCRVNGGCTISGSSTIEQNSEIDCCSTVHNSSVLAGSYVGIGLRVANAVVHQEKFLDLRRNVHLHFSDKRLFGRAFVPRASTLTGAGVDSSFPRSSARQSPTYKLDRYAPRA